MDLATLRAAMQPTGLSDARLAEYLPHFNEAMKAAQITTVRRAAAWCSQIGHESAGLHYMAEIKTSDPSWNADRTRYRGRGPIQLTWSSNYRKFGQWCQAQGYVDNSELFVQQPELVEWPPRWGFLAASWYWLYGGPRPGCINEFADANDILAVSRCVNGWVEGKMPNGWNDDDNSRLPRWNRCLALGEALLPDAAPTPGGPPMPVSGDPLWLEDVLRPALGDRLRTLPGWQGAGVGGTMGQIWGQVWHHTGSASATAQSIRDGRPDLAGPLSQLHIAQDGTVTIVAVGPCNHAGKGSWAGLPTDAANDRTIGIECAYPRNVNNQSERWPDAQIISMRDVGAALSLHEGVDASHNISHREWAQFGPAGFRQGKTDPWNLDMNWFRGEIAKDMRGEFDKPTPSTPVPPSVPAPAKVFPQGFTDRELLEYIAAQLGPWQQLGQNAKGQNLTLVDATAYLRQDVAALQRAIDSLQKGGNA